MKTNEFRERPPMPWMQTISLPDLARVRARHPDGRSNGSVRDIGKAWLNLLVKELDSQPWKAGYQIEPSQC